MMECDRARWGSPYTCHDGSMGDEVFTHTHLRLVTLSEGLALKRLPLSPEGEAWNLDLADSLFRIVFNQISSVAILNKYFS